MRVLLALLFAAGLAACESQPATPDDSTPLDDPRAESGPPLIQIEDATELVDAVIEEDNAFTVINVWATWCGPCRQEFPEFMAYDALAEADEVEVRFVSVDEADMLPAVRRFLDEHGVEERSYFAPGQDTLPAQFDPMSGYGLPTTIILDRDGIARKIHTGVLDGERLAELVDQARAATS